MKKSIYVFAAMMLSAIPAMAQDGSTVGNNAYYALAAGLAIGLAAFGGALGQAKIGAAAMDGLARNPQARNDMFVPMIIGLALVESLVIYGLVIAFMLQAKIS